MEHSIFWCKVNKFYLNKRLGYFRQRQFTPENAHLMATCVVTDRAKSKRLRSAVLELKTGKQLFLTGCGAFEKGEAMDYEKFFWLYPKLSTYREQLTLLGEDPQVQTDLGEIGEYELNREINPPQPPFLKGGGGQLTTKKFLVIQSGCDTYCTFCLTIYKRGSHRSRTLEEIIEEINQFVDAGGQELVITWVNLAARGASHTRKPKENRFSALLEAILLRTRIQRIRISSLGPEFLDDRFFDLMSNERFLPHFHVSVQHFDDEVLRRMNRNYTSQTLDFVLQWLRNLRRTDKDLISIGADLIIGFPGETQEAFDRLWGAIQTYRITKVHAFPFSPHQKGESVPAGKLPDQIPMELKRERMNQLFSVANEVRDEFKSLNIDKVWPVLLEKKVGTWWFGWTPNYLEATVPDKGYTRGEVIEMNYINDAQCTSNNVQVTMYK